MLMDAPSAVVARIPLCAALPYRELHLAAEDAECVNRRTSSSDHALPGNHVPMHLAVQAVTECVFGDIQVVVCL